MYFQDIGLLWLLLFILPMLYWLRKDEGSLEQLFSPRVLERIQIPARALSLKRRKQLLITAFAFGIIALARPVIDRGEVTIKASFIDIVVGFDISRSMFANDVYPTRLELAKQKFSDFLEYMENAKVALIGFSSRGFLIAPLTEDYNSLRFLMKNMGADQLRLRGTNMITPLEVSQELFKEEKRKALLLFTDGGDQQEYSKEIAYAKAHDITLFIYNIGTKKGGVIKGKNGVLKDAKGDIVVVKRNDTIKTLAMQTGGAYLQASLRQGDISALADAIKSKFEAETQEESTIEDRAELFYYPLLLSIFLILLSVSSLPRRSA
jgi:Ca-activated chloride channel family protein